MNWALAASSIHRVCWCAVACVITSTALGQPPAAATDAVAEQSHQSNPDIPPAMVTELRDLLQTFQAQAIDPARDDLFDIMSKSKTAKRAAEDFASALMEEFISPQLVSLMAQDYVMHRNAASPRLSGRIVRIGPDAPFQDVQAAAGKIQPGDLVLIGPGAFQMPDSGAFAVGLDDIAFVGQGATRTTLSVSNRAEIRAAKRLRLDSMRIECGDNSLCDLRSSDALHLRDCLITGYNSGAGGSNALFATNSVVLIERCAFEGLSGRAARPGSRGGTALDMRSDNWLYVRETRFIDNEEILRATFPCCFDRCVMMNTGGQGGQGVMPYSSGLIVLRESPIVRGQTTAPVKFTLTTDDVEVIRHAIGESTLTDARGKLLVESLQLKRRLPYWIGLLRHDDPEIRALAAAHLSKLINMPVSASPVETKDDDGTLHEGGSALKAELEFTRLISWYEQNNDALKWDDEAGHYVAQRK